MGVAPRDLGVLFEFWVSLGIFDIGSEGRVIGKRSISICTFAGVVIVAT